VRLEIEIKRGRVYIISAEGDALPVDRCGAKTF